MLFPPRRGIALLYTLSRVYSWHIPASRQHEPPRDSGPLSKSPSSEAFSHCHSLPLVLSRAFYCQSILPRTRLHCLQRLWTFFSSSSFDIHYSQSYQHSLLAIAGRTTLSNTTRSPPNHHHSLQDSNFYVIQPPLREPHVPAPLSN